ncbi:MAG: efflux RND transporter periplasmic adaptor subunit [Desulfobacterota bacterium]|nr:efflux RND transporter periplasmic adaptor subunit [Thermodesulfobacteriota bacterium]
MNQHEKTGIGRPLKVLVPLLIVGAFLLGYLLGGGRHPATSPSQEAHGLSHQAKQSEEDQVVWTCSMHPQIRLPAPGKCPICFMDLIPVKKGAEKGEGGALSLRQITLSPEARKLAEVAVEPVVRRSVSVQTRMVGKVDYDETRQGYITTWMAGRIDKLYVDYTGSTVTKGQAMASIYSPELLTAQAELIQAIEGMKQIEKSGLTRVRDAAKQTEQAARDKLRLLGFTSQQIEEVIQRGTPSDHITLYSPLGGVVIKKDVLEGMYVQTGTRIYTISDLSRVWVVLEAYESDLPWVKMGQQVEFQTEAHPGQVFKGVVVYVDPTVNEKTRTINVRLDVPNPGGKLKPGMFVRAVERAKSNGAREELVIPASAPLITGKRAIVYLQVPGKEGTYEGREIVLGPRAGDYYVVRLGLSEGDLVVTKGNFKVDSAVQLMAKPSMMNPQGLQESQERLQGASTAGGPSPVPEALASQLPRLAEAYDTLRAVVQQKDLQKSREAFKVFYNVLCAIDPTSLKNQSALVWQDATMLLRNDSFLGAEADTQGEAGRLFQTLTDHYQVLKERFHLERVVQTQAVSASVPAEAKRAIGKLLEEYLAIQRSLAGDDFSSAKKAGEKFASTLKGMDMALLKGEAQRLWMESSDALKKGSEKITAASDIEALRSGFEPISTGMAAAVGRLGADIQGPVFELFCPMAFNNKGATWLQQNKDVRNPYFGAQMLNCGEVKRQLKGERS